LEVGVLGFGGEFRFDFEGAGSEGGTGKGKKVGFIAAGIGITPLLGQMGTPEMSDGIITERVRVLWSLGVRDVNLALDIVQTFPRLKDVITLFLTGDEKILLDDNQDHDHHHHHQSGKDKHKHTKTHTKKQTQPNPLTQLANLGITIYRRRLQKTDVEGMDKEVDEWYLCTAPGLRKEVQGWMPGRAVVFENFDY
jgi:hypothetical protein